MTESKFKNDQNIRFLKALFYETSGATKRKHAVYTLQDEEHKGYPSLYQCYMSCGDPTEWEFATTYLDGWEHWELLQECSWFQPYVARWRKELYLREASAALKRIREAANDPEDKNHYQANKIIMDKTWEEKIPESKRRAGRPTKAEVVGALKEAREEEERLQRDYDRITNNHKNK